METDHQKTINGSVVILTKECWYSVYISNVCFETPHSLQDASLHMVCHCINFFLFDFLIQGMKVSLKPRIGSKASLCWERRDALQAKQLSWSMDAEICELLDPAATRRLQGPQEDTYFHCEYPSHASWFKLLFPNAVSMLSNRTGQVLLTSVTVSTSVLLDIIKSQSH